MIRSSCSTCRYHHELAIFKVSLDHYRRESMKILRMFQEGLPGGEIGSILCVLQSRPPTHVYLERIEKASIDEAFIDFTRPVREEILRRYPYLAEVPPDAPRGIDSPLPNPPPISWHGLGTVIEVNPSPSDTPAVGLEGLGLDEDDASTTWHDVALSIAAELMGRVRGDVYRTLGYSTSAVSHTLLGYSHSCLRTQPFGSGYSKKQIFGKGTGETTDSYGDCF